MLRANRRVWDTLGYVEAWISLLAACNEISGDNELLLGRKKGESQAGQT
jgi:hypothetical protein